MQIGSIHIDNAVILAADGGCHDIPFRLICKMMGADLVFTNL